MGDGAASGGGSHWMIQGERDLLVWAAMVPQEVVHPTTGSSDLSCYNHLLENREASTRPVA
jgi:hypothetical protein